MAGDWLKMRHDLADDPSVIRLADDRGIDEDAVIGKLFRLWSWADRHTIDGQAQGIGLRWVDRLTRCEGFGAALVRAGWLVELDAGLSFPRFDRHCSDTAKSRALDNKRKAADRSVRIESGQKPDKCPDRNRTKTGPEKRRDRSPPPPREAAPWKPESPEETWKAFRAAWNAGAAAGNRREWKPATPPEGWADRLAEVGWGDKAEEAAKRLKTCRYFETPVTLAQFLGPRFVDLCLGGQYDAPKAKKGGEPTPERSVKAWSGADADRFKATAARVNTPPG
jgi:hypothetical protein